MGACNSVKAACILACGVSLWAAGEEGAAVRVLHVGRVSSDTIGVTVQDGAAEYGSQVPYEARPGDVVGHQEQHLTVRRDGKFLGWLVGKERRLVYTPDRVVGKLADAKWMDAPASYMIMSDDDPAYAQAAVPAAVYRKTKPSDFARVEGWPFQAPLRHVLYLKGPRPFQEGKRYRVRFANGALPEQRFVCDAANLRSEAVHVSHLGFRPDDPAKVAFLSCWLGSGGAATYREGLAFRVVDAAGREAFRGAVARTVRATEQEDAYKRNYSGVDVWMMDFSGLRTPGAYRVCVDGLGCSYPFEIAEDVWRRAFTVSARGFYHQRSGVELGPPYTAYRRPACFRAENGVTVYHSECGLLDSMNGLNAKGTDKDNFGNLVKGKTDRVVESAWGGYMDAGDWDRRIQHLIASRYLIELAELFPATFDALSLNIPESKNALPDVVDEALFNLDCYRRLQTPEGGVRGGIESSEHPRHGECSWQESLDVMAYAPDVWSSAVYAGVAAQAARWLESRDAALAAVYRESALRAMAWAESKFGERDSYPGEVRDSRNLAAAELFRLTGDGAWQALFLKTTAFTKPGVDLFVWQDHDQREAPWVYVRTERPGMDERVKGLCREAILREADNRVRNCEKAGFRWAKYEWQPGQWGAFSAPDGASLARAHLLSGSEAYLRTLVLACQAGAGANPLNLCYTTGLGHESPLHPLHIDSRLTHQAPPPGITVGGPIDVKRDKNNWAQKIVAKSCYPDVQQWPTLEAYWDVFWYPPMCEFTIHSPMAQNAYAWGYLAGRR
jgi:endoglucanase